MCAGLPTNFVDGSDVEVQIDYQDKRVILEAYDEKTRHRYRLVFGKCLAVSFCFADVEDADLNNLTEGIEEITASSGRRRFRIGFADESVLEIECKRFGIKALS